MTLHGNTSGDAIVAESFADSAVVHVTDSSFASNAVPGDGAGTHVKDWNLILANTSFEGNEVHQGAGILVSGATVEIEECTFTGNSVQGSGVTRGGGAAAFNTTVMFNECIFSGNTAEDDGGGAYLNQSYSQFVNCEFDGNTALADGGGLRQVGESGHVGSLELTTCTFDNNAATGGGGRGGSVHVKEMDTVNIDGCTFRQNSSGYTGGALQAVSASVNLTGVDSLFFTNSCVEDGGAFHFADAILSMTGITFQANSASQGGGLMAVRSNVTIDDCLFTANTRADFQQQRGNGWWCHRVPQLPDHVRERL